VAAVTTQIDDRNVVAGPRVPLGDLMQRCATDGFSKATRLLTYNIKAMSDTPDGVKVISCAVSPPNGLLTIMTVPVCSLSGASNAE
jgi:hypothetical protein